MLLVFAMYLANLSIIAIFRNLEALQLGKLLHQLLHAVLLKLYCNLRIIPIAFSMKHGPFAILRMPNPRTLLQSGPSSRRFNLQLGPRNLLSSRGKEAGDVIHRLPGRCCFARISWPIVGSSQPRWSRRSTLPALGRLILILVAVVPLALLSN